MTGDVVISGSSTVQPMVSRFAGSFVSEFPLSRVNLDAPGTGEGFLLFCDGLTDLNNASRQINPVESSSCEGNGVEYIELEIARDAAVVVVSDQMTTPRCLDFLQLDALTGPLSAGADNWNAAAGFSGLDSKQVPTMPFRVVAPEAGSGTTEVYTDLVIADNAELHGQPQELRRDVLSVPTDQLVGDVVRATPGTMGILGYSVASEEQGLRTLELDGEDGCVAPNRDTIADGTYPLSRALYVYVNVDRARDSETVSSFVDRLASADLSQEAIDAGAIPAPEDSIARNQEIWGESG